MSKETNLAIRTLSGHRANKAVLRFDDVIPSEIPEGEERLDVSFISRSFAMTGLPLRKLEVRDFGRDDSHFSISISSNLIRIPGYGEFIPGLPYGAKARLLVLWMTTRARETGCRHLEIGRIDDWMASVGIPPHHDNVAMAKSQLVRLSTTTFSMMLKKENLEFFKSDTLIDSVVFTADDMIHYAEGNLAKVRFPLGIELSEKAFKRFTNADVIPVPNEALRKISSNAMAIDALLYMIYRLPRIPRGEDVLVTWRQLVAWFGNREPMSKFRQTFRGSIEKAKDAYVGADIDITDEGLILRYSPPMETRRLIAVNGGGRHLQRLRSTNRVVPHTSPHPDDSS